VAFSAPSWAQAPAFPTHALTLINPYAVGGPADLLGRVLAKSLESQLGQTVVVENKSGAGASIGAAYVAKSAPDGYTLLMGTSAAHAVTPLTTKVPYDGIKDFKFIGLVANVPNLLAVHPSLNVNTYQEFVALMKSEPGKYSYATSGTGTSPHVGMELLKKQVGLDITHIPYRGAGPAAIDMVAGTVPIGMNNISVEQPFVASGKLKALAYASDKRTPLLPNVPTLTELGVPLISGSWYSLAVPAGTPDAVVDKLARALAAAQEQPEFKAAANTQAAEILKLDRADTLKFVKNDEDMVKDLIKSGLKLSE
jgi:tripartite-type tricarboxylate transporter receptor subunit TctC